MFLKEKKKRNRGNAKKRLNTTYKKSITIKDIENKCINEAIEDILKNYEHKMNVIVKKIIAEIIKDDNGFYTDTKINLERALEQSEQKAKQAKMQIEKIEGIDTATIDKTFAEINIILKSNTTALKTYLKKF